MSKKTLIVVAHPDDESIFFSGFIQNRNPDEIRVVCVTDGNADGKGSTRAEQFSDAMKILKVKDYRILSYPDIYDERLDPKTLCEDLCDYKDLADIYTHGILGEYGHPHHQDVSYAVHQCFHGKVPIYSIAYNCFPDVEIKLSENQYQIKSQLLSRVYLSETQKFINFVPSYWSEGFAEVQFEEVQELYKYFTTGKKPDLKKLKKFGWYWPYLELNGGQVAPRPF